MNSGCPFDQVNSVDAAVVAANRRVLERFLDRKMVYT
jgi:hypothetical protein